MTHTAATRAPALFLDRDDTLIADEGYMSRPEQIHLLPGVREALQKARQAGFRLYLVTNQSGIGRGYYTMADAEACNTRLCELLCADASASASPVFDGICIAPEKPEEPSRFRKPSPAYVLEKIASDHLNPHGCWVIGDKTSDLQCGLNAGVHAALVARGNTGACRGEAAAFALQNHLPAYPSFSAAVDAICKLLPLSE